MSRLHTMLNPDTDMKKRRVIGIVLVLILLTLFLTFNRVPKLDTVEADLVLATSPTAECFQGFCIDKKPDTTLASRWWTFSRSYLQLVWMGMVFAFIIAGLMESCFFPNKNVRTSTVGGLRGTLRGLLIGPAMNLCSACIVPVASAFRRRGASVETTLAITQGSSTMNLPALIMTAMVFTPLIGGGRLGIGLVAAFLLGPLVVWMSRRSGLRLSEPSDTHILELTEITSSWRETIKATAPSFVRSTIKYVLRLGPVMVLAGFGSGLAIQWVSPDTVTTWLGNDISGIAIAASLGIAINVPLLFEIPLVAAMLLAGMGTAPSTTLLFTAAAGGPITFWGLSKVMPIKAVFAFGVGTWVLGFLGGIVVLAIMATLGSVDVPVLVKG